jgi:plastocyanin
MSKTLLAIFAVSGLLAIGVPPASAQEPVPTPAELTLHPGDTITWTTSGPHRLRFGGSVTHNGAPLTLTSFADVQKVLDITPPLTADAQGIARAPSGTTVTAKVKTDAATQGVSEFFFTCGFDPHKDLMVTVSFQIAASSGDAPRTLQINSANPPRWVLKDTPDKNLTRP